jgi:hypothetical protein
VCFLCPASYRQPQGRTRHIREAHNPSVCLFCDFKWGRRYEYRKHLKNRHPSVNRDRILGKPPRPRCGTTIRTEHLPQQPPISPPAVEQDQQNGAESQPHPPAPPSAGASVTSVSPPAVSPVDYNSQPVYAEQTITVDEREYAHGSFLGLGQSFLRDIFDA